MIEPHNTPSIDKLAPPWFSGVAFVFFLLFCLLLSAAPAAADIYAYIDDDGVIHLSDQDDDPRYRLLVRFPREGGSNPPERYARLIRSAANRHGLDAALVKAVIHAESSFNPEAVSPAGAVGLMQLMPELARRYGVRDRRNPEDNIEGGARHLRDLLDKYNNNIQLSLAAYNAGEAAVSRYGNQVPPYRETRNYVTRVMRFYRRYRGRN